jgi:hypothetical protein
MMNRKERRLAKYLGAHWVAQRANGVLEVCMGGEACGCVPGREDRRRASAQRTAGPGRSTDSPRGAFFKAPKSPEAA